MKKGFTLIEILVVISIIGILAALSLISFSGAQKQARDTQRKSDLNQFRSALESFANSNGGLYPSRTNTTRASGSLCSDLKLGGCVLDPKYPASGYDYKYESNGTGSGTTSATQYVLWGQLENTTNYWVVCSNGKSGNSPISGWTDPQGGSCPV